VDFLYHALARTKQTQPPDHPDVTSTQATDRENAQPARRKDCQQGTVFEFADDARAQPQRFKPAVQTGPQG
jgi:hypothetical protein